MTNVRKLLVAVVLPSLNEEALLWETCKSLGFCQPEEQLPDAFLFIIDNGSTDGTLEVARAIQRNATRGSVVIGHEEERGYVPPRHTGNMLVKAFAESNGLDPSEILILQADADTSYGEGYIDRMRSASQTLGTNILVEGLAEFSQWFRDSFPEYFKLSVEIDTRALAALKFKEMSSLICTDAVCGYRLSDYISWGGHLREYHEDGDEIHAETTRLYMRALAHGARKAYVEEALAHPSERKIINRPVEELARAGFPREASWNASWRCQHDTPISLADFHEFLGHPTVLHAIHLRQQHLVALFGVLPLHVTRALRPNLYRPRETALGDIAASLPERSRGMLYRSPGTLLTDVLTLVDHDGTALSDALVGQE